MRALEFIIGHVIFKLCYNQIYQRKTTLLTINFLWKKRTFATDQKWLLAYKNSKEP